MKLATQDRSFFGSTYEQKLNSLKTLGFEGFEIDGRNLIDRYDEIRRAVLSTGIPISSVCGGYRGWIGDFDAEERAKAIADIGEILKYTGDIGAAGVIVPAAFGIFSKKLPPFQSPRAADEERRILLDSLAQLNEHALKAGSFLLLEPLNRYEDHMINRLDEAGSLIREGEFAAVEIMADFFHMQIEEPDVNASLRAEADLIAHVHLADSNRLQPGYGHTDFTTYFQTLREIGFDGYMAVECELAPGDGMQAYAEMAAYLKSCINAD
ncbi:sugar phosphate isomerase/epimerase family protein [Paenibacillus sacheonensis]|uniref:TIM barrel protein n=1 Tax=Paenibacillus sacheonensis TaxID=742054 RepID=A0A7X4YMW2_9BACL|nr:sugar phosphate isomerase/epimerase family protein [Paenibacillus sacheonensis]MBM7564741.1 sugar phosphate isomerase/epimerase [Paenibacillus sacheonensis]NBC69296.1 TIM barrel protein [Paenibacillus sacheonensis]